MPLIDSFGRTINYLRLSVTDRCNLRCRYCMPAEGIAKLRHEEILSFEEIMLLADAAVRLGIEKIRVTGGEPLVRKGIISLLSGLAGIPNLRELVMTTNGTLLANMAADIMLAGVKRLNVSLDSLKPATFNLITRCGELEKVLAGIRAAETAGFPIKINMVAMRGINDDEFVDFARLTLAKPYGVRFIEYMPTMDDSDWRTLHIPGNEILASLNSVFSLEPVRSDQLSGPSKNFRIQGAAGTLGIITAVSSHFCCECNRIRVTASGRVKTCLFSEQEYDLRPLLRAGDVAGLEEALREIVRNKPEKHHFSDKKFSASPFSMSDVGG